MKSEGTIRFLNPVQVCGLVIFIISAPRVLTETNCECLVISKQSGEAEWIDDCPDTTTGFTSTTFTGTTSSGVGDLDTQTPQTISTPDSNTPTAKTNPLSTPSKNLTPVKTTPKLSLGNPLTRILTSTLTPPREKPGTKPTSEKAEATSEPSEIDGVVVGGVIGGVVGLAAIIVLVILLWKLGVFKRFQERYCRSSKVGSYNVENGEVSQNGTRPGDKSNPAADKPRPTEKTIKAL